MPRKSSTGQDQGPINFRESTRSSLKEVSPMERYSKARNNFLESRSLVKQSASQTDVYGTNLSESSLEDFKKSLNLKPIMNKIAIFEQIDEEEHLNESQYMSVVRPESKLESFKIDFEEKKGRDFRRSLEVKKNRKNLLDGSLGVMNGSLRMIGRTIATSNSRSKLATTKNNKRRNVIEIKSFLKGGAFCSYNKLKGRSKKKKTTSKNKKKPRKGYFCGRSKPQVLTKLERIERQIFNHNAKLNMNKSTEEDEMQKRRVSIAKQKRMAKIRLEDNMKAIQNNLKVVDENLRQVEDQLSSECRKISKISIVSKTPVLAKKVVMKKNPLKRRASNLFGRNNGFNSDGKGRKNGYLQKQYHKNLKKKISKTQAKKTIDYVREMMQDRLNEKRNSHAPKVTIFVIFSRDEKWDMQK